MVRGRPRTGPGSQGKVAAARSVAAQRRAGRRCSHVRGGSMQLCSAQGFRVGSKGQQGLQQRHTLLGREGSILYGLQ